MSYTLWITFSAIISLYMGISGYMKRSLSLSGAISAIIVGFITFSLNAMVGITLIAFFLSSSKLTKYGAEEKKWIEKNYKIYGERNLIQVLSNSFSATFLLILIPVINFYFISSSPLSSLSSSSYQSSLLSSSSSTQSSTLPFLLLGQTPPSIPSSTIPPSIFYQFYSFFITTSIFSIFYQFYSFLSTTSIFSSILPFISSIFSSILSTIPIIHIISSFQSSLPDKSSIPYLSEIISSLPDPFAIPYLPSSSYIFTACIVGAISHYACCCSDTWSSEIGSVSKTPPILITTLKKVPAGTNGGCSKNGLIAGIAGGIFIGLVSSFFTFFQMIFFGADMRDLGEGWKDVVNINHNIDLSTHLNENIGQITEISSQIGGQISEISLQTPPFSQILYTCGHIFAIGISCGLLGTLLDSLLGAILQCSVFDIKEGMVYEILTWKEFYEKIEKIGDYYGNTQRITEKINDNYYNTKNIDDYGHENDRFCPGNEDNDDCITKDKNRAKILLKKNDENDNTSEEENDDQNSSSTKKGRYKHISGYPFLDNHQVNLLSSTIIGFAASTYMFYFPH